MAHRCNHCQATCAGYRASDPEPSPDIALLMATNNPPSASQEEEFHRIRVDGVKRLAELDTIIEELHQTLEGIMVERNALAWKVEHHRLVLNPVRRLPADILREIFLFACARTTQPSHSYLTPPTFLAAVCRSWNHIAVTSAQLWRQCKLSLYKHKYSQGVVNEDNAYLLSGVSISRSATCPLWLDLRLVNFSYADPVYPFLLVISSRVQRMRLRTRDLGFLGSPEFRRFADALTTLAYMDLCLENTGSAPSTTLSLPHSLQHLIITPYPEFSAPEVDLNWSHLRSLVLRCLDSPGTSAHPTLRMLSRVRRLRSLTFSDDCENTYGSRADSHEVFDALITMAHVTDMVVETSTPPLYDVLAKISTPSLEHLVIKGVAHEIFPHVNDMLQRSDYTLQHLTLQSLGGEHGSVDTVDDADSLIRLCGSLRELSLLDIKAGAESITQLLSSLESLPQLRVLALDISNVHDFGTTT